MKKKQMDAFLKKISILDKRDKSKIEYIKGYLDAKISNKKIKIEED